MPDNHWQKIYRHLPYQSGGRDHGGVDCYGLVSLIYREQLGITLPDYTNEYENASSAEQASAVIQAHMGDDWEDVKDPKPFDVIVFRLGQYPCHLGIVYRPGWMIHCLAGTRVTCERFTDRIWKKRTFGFRRYCGKTANLPVPSYDIPVSARPHPLSMERVAYIAAPGSSLSEIISQTGALPLTGHAYVGDRYVPRNLWAATYPRDCEMVTFVATLPRGGDGDDKGILRVVAMIAVAVAAYYTGGWAAGLAKGTWYAGAVKAGVTAAVSVAGSMAVNALIPPATPERLSGGGEDSQPSYIISSSRNRLKPWEAIPLVLGTVYNYAPPLASRPWTEIVGNDAYHHMLVLWGYGPLEIRDLKIGDTPVHNFNGVDIATIPEYTPGQAIPNWAGTVYEESMNVLLSSADGYTQRTVTGVDEVTWIFTFPQLVKITDEGDKVNQTVNLEVQYREVGEISWNTCTASALSFPARYWLAASIPASHSNSTGYYTLIVQNIGRFVWRSSATGYPGVPSGYYGIAQVKIRKEPDRSGGTTRYYFDEVNDIRSGTGITGMAVTTSNGGTSTAKVSLSSGSIDSIRLSVTASQTSAVRRSLNFNLPENGDYEVRVRRVTPDTTDSQISDKVYWSGLQSIVHESPIQGPPGVSLAVTALRIKASEQLSGSVDELNGTVSSILTDSYNTATGNWDYKQASSQPGDLIRHVLQSDVMARPQADTKLDLQSLAEFVEFTTDESLSYNNVIERPIETMSLVREIAAAGRGMPRMVDGKWSVVVDKVRDEYAQTFIAENIWNLSVSKSLDIPAPHGWRVIFRNEEQRGSVDERIVYDDGYTVDNAADIQILELPGVSHPDAVWKLARYHIAVSRLRPRIIEFYADMEHLVCQRGDLTELNHPTPLWGAGSGRVKSVQKNAIALTSTFEDTQDSIWTDTQDSEFAAAATGTGYDVTGVTLTDKVSMEAGKSYGARFRLADGTRKTVNVVTDPGDTDTLIFSSVIPHGSPAPEPDDICAFGEVEKITTDLIVKNIIPIEGGDKYSARIECVDYSPAIFDADVDTIPAFNPNITQPIDPERATPAAPVITQVVADETAMIRLPDGSLQQRIMIEFTAGSGGNIPHSGFRVQYKLSSVDDWEALPNLPEDATRAVVPDVDEGRIYDIRVAALSRFGARSTWNDRTGITVQISAPGVPTAIKTIFIGGNRYLSWKAPVGIAAPKYEIKRGSSWDNGQKIGETLDTKFMISGPGLYWLASKYGSKYSDTQTSLSVTNWGIQANVIAIRDQAADGWPGDKETGLSVVGSNLVLDGAVAAEATYTFSTATPDDRVTLASAAKCQVAYELSVYGEGPDDDVYSWTDVYVIENVYGSYGDEVDALVEISVKDESDVWSAWEEMVTTEYYGTGFHFRLTLYSEDTEVLAGASDFIVQVDVPDRSENKQGVSIGTAGASIVYTKPFNEVPTTHVQIVDAQDGDYAVLTNETVTGFDVTIKNTGTNIARIVNWRAQGY